MNDITPPVSSGAEATPVAEAPVATPETPAQEQPKAEANYAEELKKVQNALAKEKRRIGKLTAEKYQYKGQLDALTQQYQQYQGQPKVPSNGKPDLEDYKAKGKTWGEYTEDLADWKVSQRLEQERQKSTETQSKNEQDAWRAERDQALQDDAAEARTAFTDFVTVVSEYQEEIRNLPEHIVDAFREQDKPAHAMYALIKDGKFDELLQAKTATRAAALIAKAEERAKALNVKPVTKAPAPMTPAKGTAPGSKTIDSMSGAELRAWVRS